MGKFLMLLFIAISFGACHSRRSGNTEPAPKAGFTTFTDEETGWTTQFANEYKPMTESQIRKLEQRGQEAIEETIDGRIELGYKNLLWLRKDQFNAFTSNSQSYDPSVDGSYVDNQKKIAQTLEDTFRHQNIQFDVRYAISEIDGLEFGTMETTLYTPDRSKVILHQVIYDRLINNKISLTMNINYNNDDDKAVLLDIIRSSKFSKRN